MTEQEFLAKHYLLRNPFSEEDAQTDAVFKTHCISELFHPAWSKVFGDPSEPATALVLGEKGSGKTAMRLQLMQQFSKHNQGRTEGKVFFIEYDDFNRYLGPFQETQPRKIRENPDKMLQAVRLWDHMDAMLCEAVTTLVDRAIEPKKLEDPNNPIEQKAISSLDRAQRRDFLLLAACYDQSRQGTYKSRWQKLRRRLHFTNISTWTGFAIGLVVTLLVIAACIALARADVLSIGTSVILAAIGIFAGWAYYLARFFRHWWLAKKVTSVVRVGRRDVGSLREVLMSIPAEELASQPLPIAARTDDRYSMLEKLQALLRSLGFNGMVVLIDRVDEPEFVNGKPERMRDLIWPMLDNKLLKHPGLGLKMLLPSELQYYLERETREFDERARLDKQNVVRNFDWTGEALYGLVSARMAACATEDEKPTLRDLLDSSISEPRLISALQSLRTPRALFRFLFRLVVEHCKRAKISEPEFKISSDLFESTLAVFQSESNRAHIA